MTIAIISFGILDSEGLHSPAGSTAWTAEQKGPLDVERSQVFDRPHMGFGKLCAPEKLAFSAASLALKGIALPDNRSGIGIVIGSLCGSLSTDRAFMASVDDGFPGPALFAATLPSTPLAEIAIMHKLTGPKRVFCGGQSPFDALDSACRILRRGSAKQVLCSIVCDGTDGSPIWAASLLLAIKPGTALPDDALIISTLPAPGRVDRAYFRNLAQNT